MERNKALEIACKIYTLREKLIMEIEEAYSDISLDLCYKET